MIDEQVLNLEKINNKIVRCSELLNTIGQNNQESEQLQARLNVINSIPENERTREDVQFLGMAPEKLAYRKKISEKAYEQLMNEIENI